MPNRKNRGKGQKKNWQGKGSCENAQSDNQITADASSQATTSSNTPTSTSTSPQVTATQITTTQTDPILAKESATPTTGAATTPVIKTLPTVQPSTSTTQAKKPPKIQDIHLQSKVPTDHRASKINRIIEALNKRISYANNEHLSPATRVNEENNEYIIGSLHDTGLFFPIKNGQEWTAQSRTPDAPIPKKTPLESRSKIGFLVNTTGLINDLSLRGQEGGTNCHGLDGGVPARDTTAKVTGVAQAAKTAGVAQTADAVRAAQAAVTTRAAQTADTARAAQAKNAKAAASAQKRNIAAGLHCCTVPRRSSLARDTNTTASVYGLRINISEVARGSGPGRGAVTHYANRNVLAIDSHSLYDTEGLLEDMRRSRGRYLSDAAFERQAVGHYVNEQINFGLNYGDEEDEFDGVVSKFCDEKRYRSHCDGPRWTGGELYLHSFRYGSFTRGTRGNAGRSTHGYYDGSGRVAAISRGCPNCFNRGSRYPVNY